MGLLGVVVGAGRGPGPSGQPQRGECRRCRRVVQTLVSPRAGRLMKAYQSTYHRLESVSRLLSSDAPPVGE